MKLKQYELEPGESGFSATKCRVIEVVSNGLDTYIWIGNGEWPEFCYGTLGGRTLVALRDQIDAALCKEKPKRKARSV